jgi:hypothetical protein
LNVLTPIKKALKSFFASLVLIVATLLMLLYLLFHNNTFQNWLGSKATVYLSEQFKAPIHIGKIIYKPFTRFALEEVYFGDHKNDTLFYVSMLSFRLGKLKPDSMFFGLKNVVVHEGYCKLITYADSSYNLSVLFNIIDPNDTIPDTLSPPFHLYMDKVTLRGGHFKLYDYTARLEEKGFDGLHEDFYDIALALNDFHIIQDSLTFRLKHMACKEVSGFVLHEMRAVAVIAPTIMKFDSLYIKTPHSEIGNSFAMKYESWDDLPDFNNKVWLSGKLVNSKVSMRDIAFFAPALEYMREDFLVNATASGTVSSLRVRNIDVSFGKSSSFKGSVNMTGLPNIDETYIDASVKDFYTHAHDIEPVIDMKLPDAVHRFGDIDFSGAFNGFIGDFVAYGVFNTEAGSIRSDLNLKFNQQDSIPAYFGSVSVYDLKLGYITDLQKYLGAVSLKLDANGKGFDLKSLEANLKSDIHYLQAYGYTYKKLHFDGNFKKKQFDGVISSNDTNASFSLTGLIDLNEKNPLYKINADIRLLDLKALGFDTTQNIVSANLDVDFRYTNIDVNEGHIYLNNLLFIKHGRDYPIKEFQLTTTSQEKFRDIKFRSDGIDLQLSGNYRLADMDDIFKDMASTIFPDYFGVYKGKPLFDQHFNFKAQVKDLNTYSALFFPSYNVQSFTANIKFDGAGHLLTGSTEARRVFIKDMRVDRFALSMERTDAETRKISSSIKRFNIGDTTIFNNLLVTTVATRNQLISYVQIKDSIERIFADVELESQFESDRIASHFNHSGVSIRDVQFTINDEGIIAYEGDRIKMDELFVQIDKSQSLYVNGFYDFKGNQNIRVNLSEIDLSIIGKIYRKFNFELGGLTNGALVFKTSDKTQFIDAFLKLENLVLDKDTIGDFNINTNYNEKQHRFLVYAKSIAGKLKNLEMGGHIDTENKPARVSINFAFDESPLTAFQAFLKDQLHIFEGRVSARARLNGDLDHLVLDGDARFSNVKARVEYLKTIYRFSSVLQFSQNKFDLLPAEVMDDLGNKANLSGVITHQFFKNLKFDISLQNMNRFHVLNTEAKDNDLFYGKAYATGFVTLTGTPDNIFLEARVRTAPNTVIYIPFAQSDVASGTGLVNYVSYNTTRKVELINKLSGISGFTMALYADITPDAEMQMIIDPRYDDRIKGRGRGLIKMELTKQGDFTMFGKVDIEDGDYKLTAMEFLSRQFLIQKGSSISWAGNPMDVRLDITGVYKVRRTSIADFVTTATNEERQQMRSQRVPVNCILQMQGGLTNPDIKFDIEFPDLQGMIGSNNVSSIDNSLRNLRNNPDMMNQQVISLLLFGRFAPPNGLTQANQQGNLSSGINNTFSDLLTQQANNLVGKIIPGLEFNVDIQTANDQVQQTQYIFSASKKWFDDRLEVQGSYDPRNFNNSLMTQYNLSKTGNLKARFFNRNTTDAYSRNVTTQGIGLYYRKEFDTFTEIFKKKNTKTQ